MTEPLKRGLSGKQNDEKKLFSFAPAMSESDAASLRGGYSYWKSTLTAFSKNKTAMILLWIGVAILVFSFIQPLLPGQYPASLVNNDPFTGLPLKNLAPCRRFLLGTNEIGQDLWARLWAGARNSLLIGFAVAAFEATAGMLTGVLWGYVRSLDPILTELYNITDNIPTTMVLILFSYILKPGAATIILALSLTGWIGMARFIRNQVLILRDRDFIIASRCLGVSTPRIIFRDILPYLVPVAALKSALSIPAAIGSEVFITYIGLGLPASVPSLGNLINIGRKLMLNPSLRYQLIFPALLLSAVTVSFYIVGNALADAADPKKHR